MASISDRVGDLGGYLREQREHARLSLRQLAQLAGVSNPYLSQVERGLRKPSAEVLQQIARGLRISAEALYVRAGILESEQQRPDVEAAVHADPDLTDRQKRVLLDIYHAFRAENARETADTETPVPAPRRRAAKRAAKEATAGSGEPRRSRRKAEVAGEEGPPVQESSAPEGTAPESSTPESTAGATGSADPTGAPRKPSRRAAVTRKTASGSVPHRRPRRSTGEATGETAQPADD
ncbi:MAG TPA: helix-turn-helix domain-containing protein [Kineosporiaceae bacterium]|nr:helix-turn-helix domain-containing protein [Kineosporiaceae bacterium]